MSQTGSPPGRNLAGISTSAPGFLFAQVPHPTPARTHLYFNDFDTYAAGDWTVTTGGTGTSALIDANGGQIAVTTDAATNDVQGNQLAKKTFAFTANSQFWFGINFKLSHATNSAFMAGVGSSFATLAPTDGVYISKVAGSATCNVIVRASSSTSATLALGTLVADTFYTMGFYYNGTSSPSLLTYSTVPYLNGTAPGGATGNTAFGQNFYFNGGNQQGAAAGTESQAQTVLTLPTANLTAGWAIKANTTVAQVATIDWFHCESEIVARF